MVTGIKRLCSVEKKCQQVSLYSENGDFTDMDSAVCQVVSANVRNFMFCTYRIKILGMQNASSFFSKLK